MKLVKYSAVWCSPCSQLQKVIDSIDDFPIPIEHVDIDEQSELAMQNRVRGVPTLVLVDDKDNEIKRNVGMMTKEALLEWIK